MRQIGDVTLIGSPKYDNLKPEEFEAWMKWFLESDEFTRDKPSGKFIIKPERFRAELADIHELLEYWYYTAVKNPKIRTPANRRQIADLVEKAGYYDLADTIRHGNHLNGQCMDQKLYDQYLEEAADIINEASKTRQ